MSPFITYRDTNDNGELNYYILQREFPNYIGLISVYREKVLVDAIDIIGYNLWIVFNGTIKGSMIPSYKNVHEEIKDVLKEMSEWYYINRVIPQEKKYKKFKK